jgi:hypothetical protein
MQSGHAPAGEVREAPENLIFGVTLTRRQLVKGGGALIAGFCLLAARSWASAMPNPSSMSKSRLQTVDQANSI